MKCRANHSDIPNRALFARMLITSRSAVVSVAHGISVERGGNNGVGRVGGDGGADGKVDGEVAREGGVQDIDGGTGGVRGVGSICGKEEDAAGGVHERGESCSTSSYLSSLSSSASQ